MPDSGLQQMRCLAFPRLVQLKPDTSCGPFLRAPRELAWVFKFRCVTGSAKYCPEDED
jgi:hypothetical protein